MADLAASVYELCEADVPGASLHGRDPGMLTVPELKRWLACRGASRRGRKADLVLRVSEHIVAGLDKEIVDPDGGANVERKRAQLICVLCMLLCMFFFFFFFFLKLHKTERDKLDIITVPRNSSANVCNGFFFFKGI